MEFCYSISKFKTFSSDQAKKIFPDNFQLNTENGNFFLIVRTESVSDSEVFIEVQQECDRIFFLTGEQLSPQFQWRKNADGVITHQQSIRCDARLVKGIPENIAKQQWNLALAVQLRLWQLAKLSDLPIAARINLLFQIIEITFPDRGDKASYPEYVDSSVPPCSKKESLLLRDLVSHGKGRINNPQLKKYCEFLKVDKNFHDPIDVNFTKAVKSRVNIIEQEARRVINEQITLNK